MIETYTIIVFGLFLVAAIGVLCQGPGQIANIVHDPHKHEKERSHE